MGLIGQLILPEPLKLLPLSTLGLIKNPLFQDGISADERAFLFASVSSMPTYGMSLSHHQPSTALTTLAMSHMCVCVCVCVIVSVPFVCPRLFSLHDIPDNTCIAATDGRVYIPSALELSSAVYPLTTPHTITCYLNMCMIYAEWYDNSQSIEAVCIYWITVVICIYIYLKNLALNYIAKYLIVKMANATPRYTSTHLSPLLSTLLIHCCFCGWVDVLSLIEWYRAS
jgi:hypothetical protein